MTQKLKRYGFRIGKPERGNVETILPVEDHLGTFVKYEDILPLIQDDVRYIARVELFDAIFKNLEEVGWEETLAWMRSRHQFEKNKLKALASVGVES